MPNSENVFTVRHWGVVVAMVAVLITGGTVIATKADKQEVEKVEQRMARRIHELKEDVKEMRDKIESKQDRMYDLLLDIKKNGGVR